MRFSPNVRQPFDPNIPGASKRWPWWCHGERAKAKANDDEWRQCDRSVGTGMHTHAQLRMPPPVCGGLSIKCHHLLRYLFCFASYCIDYPSDLIRDPILYVLHFFLFQFGSSWRCRWQETHARRGEDVFFAVVFFFIVVVLEMQSTGRGVKKNIRVKKNEDEEEEEEEGLFCVSVEEEETDEHLNIDGSLVLLSQHSASIMKPAQVVTEAITFPLLLLAFAFQSGSSFLNHIRPEDEENKAHRLKLWGFILFIKKK